MRRVFAEAAVLLSAGIMLYIVLSAPALPAVNTGGGISVTEATEISGSENIAIDIRRPLISGLDDMEFQGKLNGNIENQIAISKEAAKVAADEFWRETKAKGYDPWQYVFYAGYEVKNTKSILSLKVTTLLYAGGTGMPVTEYYNADINRSHLLTLGDLFKSGKYKEVIYGIIKEQMDKGPDMYFIEDFKAITDSAKFFIHGGSLYITFSKYEVASGIAGEPEFRIPTNMITGYLKKEYKEIFR